MLRGQRECERGNPAIPFLARRISKLFSPPEFPMENDIEQKKVPFSVWLQEKLAASRFLTISLLLHVVLVVLGGSVVLFKQYVEPPDFVAEGGVVSGDATVQLPPDQPPDLTQQQSFTPDQPQIAAPSVSAITSTTSTATSFTMSAAPAPVVKVMGDTKMAGATMPTNIGAGLSKGLPSTMAGRAGGTARSMAAMKTGGKEKSEKAVVQGLRWLKQVQGQDGAWGDGAYKPAMTGLSILCYLGHGETPESPEFGPTVKKALDWILVNGTKNQGKLMMSTGPFAQGGVYQHAIVAYAVGEYFTMTKDERFIPLFKQAIGFIVDGQAPDGGWQYDYAKGPDSDTSVSGWQIQALKAAHLSELKIAGVDDALDKAMLNLKRVQGPKGGFGYRKAADTYSLTGVGVLCTYFWKQDKDKVVKNGIEFMLKETEEHFPVKYKGEQANLYAWYYNTQACLMFGGSAWTKWNRMFQEEVSSSQTGEGYWPVTGATKPAHGPEGQDTMSGKVYRTALCVLMLEVFYRYMPTTK
jgi:hypothetical protein